MREELRRAEEIRTLLGRTAMGGNDALSCVSQGHGWPVAIYPIFAAQKPQAGSGEGRKVKLSGVKFSREDIPVTISLRMREEQPGIT